MKGPGKAIWGGSELAEKHDDYLEQLEEWQEHQYSPGYYAGKMHPLIAANRNPKLLGWSLIVAAIFLLLGVLFSVLVGYGSDRRLLLFGLVTLSVILVQAGRRWIRKAH